jgi:adenylate cyclase
VNTDRAAIAHLRHELRTPLNSIIGYSEMLLEEMAGGGIATFETGLRTVREGAQRLLVIFNDFFGQVSLEKSRVDLGRLAIQASGPLNAVAAAVDELKNAVAIAGVESASQDLDRIALAVATLRRMIVKGDWPKCSTATIAEAPRDAALGGRSTHDAEALPRDAGVILVVDDNPANRELLRRQLIREGHEVLLCASGREALDLLRQQRVDLILLDVLMPEIDGYEVLHQLRAAPALLNIPVLMVSALDEMESVVRCIELGAEDYLTKPFDPVLLRARIGACLEKKRLRDREAMHLRKLAEWNETLEHRVAEQVSLVDRLGRLKRFFSPQLADLIVAGGADDPLKTHRREVTVCFVDLRGFTAFAEIVEPEEVMGVLREYHAEMGRLIIDHEGTLERFTGDGMMIFFNDPVPVHNAAERTILMALEMRTRVAELITGWRKLGYDLDLGIGIAQGYATIGAIGYEGRWDYGAIGSVTNLASRLCGEAKPGQILVPQRVLAKIDDLVETELVGELTLKGFHRPVTAYNIIRVEMLR